jgi:hypothetical protein
MKKSIRGNIKAKTQADKESIVADINKYLLWKLDTQGVIDEETGEESFAFEAWVENDQDESKLFTDMKRHADKHKGKLDRHDCTHDEKEKKPCKIAEEYSAE